MENVNHEWQNIEHRTRNSCTLERQTDRYFEKRFQQVASATGLTNPDAIINKFGLKEEIKQELNAEIKQKNSELNELAYELRGHQQELELAKSQFQESKWKDVDVLYKVVHDSQANATHHQNECDRLDERLAYYREGMLALLSMLPEELMGQDGSILGSMEGADMSHEKTMNLIQVLGDKLLGLSDMVTEGEMMRVQRQRDLEDQKRQQEAQNQARLAQEIAEKLKMSSMMRRNTTKTAAQYAGLEEAEGPSDNEDDLDDDGEGGVSQGDDAISGDEPDQDQLQRTQPRGAMPAYGGDQQYEVASY